MSIIESIRNYISTCPLLKDGYININRLDMDPVTYTIDDVAAQPILKTYTDGGTLRQAVFLFASAEDYSKDAVENLKACGFYEEFSSWLEEQTNSGNLPQLEDGSMAQKIEATTNGYSFLTDEAQRVQRYQIQCRLIYLKD